MILCGQTTSGVIRKVDGQMKRKSIFFLGVIVYYTALVIPVFANSGQKKQPQTVPYHSLLMCTNTIIRSNFYAYMRCRHSAKEEFLYRHQYVSAGDKIFFENGQILEIEKNFYSYNGVTNSIPNQLMFNCLITATTNLPNRCIWSCK